MTIVYCDYINGDDTNGTGAWDAPYKTINKASTNLTGGDEVRVAKSPDPTPLTGTLTFTQNSTAVTGSGTSFTTELAIGDFILGADGYWWEAVTISSNTSLTLYKKYSGSTASGVSSQKLGITSTGEAGTIDTTVQSVSASGFSDSSRLKISGGWNLSTQEQTGQTYFRQMHTTFANRYGYGLYVSGKTFTEISRLHFLRYYIGLSLENSGGNNNIISPVCCSNGGHGIFIDALNNKLISPISNANAGYGLYIYNNSNLTSIISPICNSNGSYGITIMTYNNIIDSPSCNFNGNIGIHFNGSSNNIIISPTCNSNNYYGIQFTNAHNNNIYGALMTSGNNSGGISNNRGINFVNKASIAEATKVAGFGNYANSRLFINDIGGNSQIWTDGANAVGQNATAGGTGKEWKLSITGAHRTANYPFSVAVAPVPVNANKQVTVRLYFKKSGTGIAGRLIVRGGQIAGVDNDVYTECPDDTNRNQVILQFTPTEKGVVEIEVQAWYVSSTTDYIIVDDIDITQEN